MLRLSDARRSTSALKDSSYLRRSSGADPLTVAAITEEVVVLLLSTIPKLLHYSIAELILKRLFLKTNILIFSLIIFRQSQ